MHLLSTCVFPLQRPPADPDAAASTGSSGPESVRLRYLGISSAGEDADVTAERRRLAAVPRSQLPKTNVVVLADVTKKFGALTAVDRVSSVHALARAEHVKKVLADSKSGPRVLWS